MLHVRKINFARSIGKILIENLYRLKVYTKSRKEEKLTRTQGLDRMSEEFNFTIFCAPLNSLIYERVLILQISKIF